VRFALSSTEVRAAEEAVVRSGTLLSELMDRAGTAVAAEASAIEPDGLVVVVAGKGNNGGDGWVAARALRENGRDVHVVTVVEPESLRSPALEAALAAIEAGVPWSLAQPSDDLVVRLAEAALVIDALLGIGISGPPSEPYAELIDAINDSDVPVLAVDLPSGVDADSGRVPGAAVAATGTLTFGQMKPGLVFHPGAEAAGFVGVADIGLPDPDDATGALEVWDWEDYADLLVLPSPDDHKGSRGRVLVVGGSEGLTGAPCLTCMGALRAGAGYVTAAAPQPVLAIVETKLTAAVKRGLPWDGGAGRGFAEAVLDAASRNDAVVLGNGLGRAESTLEAVRALVPALAVPLVLDADGLYALGADVATLRSRSHACVITPHAGEAARLLGIDVAEVLDDRVAAAKALSGGSLTCLLKGARTLVAGDGRIVVNMSGNPGLATLGTGDVLAGILGTMLAQGLDALDAAALAAYLHGAAGDAAADDLTAVCCTAEDVVTYLPDAFRSLMLAD
jgi:ADP-dependent NAD(P)H-hydrate dehydratase / NAD(P)H-hydrate epimerase